MANTQKITKAQKFAMLKAIPEVAQNEMLMEFIEHEIDLLNRKNTTDKKPTAQQMANDGIKGAIYDYMEPGKLYTITDLQKKVPACAELTNQRVSALVRQMIDAGKVDRIEEKNKAYFRKVAE